MSKLGNAASGAASGAATGSMFGPWGTAIGAIGGGLLGLFGGEDSPPRPVFGAGNEDVYGRLHGGMLASAGYDPAAAGEAARNAAYGFSESRLNPEWAARSGQLNTLLANQGLDPGTEAYGNASRQFGNQMNDAYAQARAQAFGLGNQTQQVGIQQAMLPYQQNAALVGADERRYNAGVADYGIHSAENAANNEGLFSFMGSMGSLAKNKGIQSLFGFGG